MEKHNFYTVVPLAIFLIFGTVVIQGPKWANSFMIKHQKVIMGLETINLTLTKDPIQLYKIWRDDARALSHINLRPDAVTIAFQNGDGTLSTDIVMIRDICDKGFRFYTNSDSNLSQSINKNSSSAFTVIWTFNKIDGSSGMRYVNVQGSISKLPQPEKAAFFKSEPITTKIRILLKTQKNEKKQMVSQRLESLLQEYHENPRGFLAKTEIPSNWEGYIISPKSLEFYQGTKDSIGNRLKFTRGLAAPSGNSYKPILPVGSCGGEKGWIFQEMEP